MSNCRWDTYENHFCGSSRAQPRENCFGVRANATTTKRLERRQIIFTREAPSIDRSASTAPISPQLRLSQKLITRNTCFPRDVLSTLTTWEISERSSRMSNTILYWWIHRGGTNLSEEKRNEVYKRGNSNQPIKAIIKKMYVIFLERKEINHISTLQQQQRNHKTITESIIKCFFYFTIKKCFFLMLSRRLFVVTRWCTTRNS